jgi:hypothetical protein
MRRAKRTNVGEERVKKITIKRSPKKTVFVVQYADGRRAETPYVEVQGSTILYLDPVTREPTIRTEANVNLGQTVNSCAVCGEDVVDQHAHA